MKMYMCIFTQKPKTSTQNPHNKLGLMYYIYIFKNENMELMYKYACYATLMDRRFKLPLAKYHLYYIIMRLVSCI